MAEPATIVQSDNKTVATPAPLKNDGPPPGGAIAEKPIAIKRRWFVGRTIAFSINDYSIEMAVVSSRLSKIKLIDIQKQYISSNFDDIKRWALIGDAISEYLEEFSSKYTRVCIGLSGPETCYRTFLMPALKARQMASAVVFEIRKQLPFPITDCNYDYRPISHLSRGDQAMVKISLAAATKNFVKRILSPIEKTGRHLALVYNASEAVGQLLRHLPEFDPERNYALICIDRERTLMSYYRGSDLIFYHYASLGSAIIAGRTDAQRFDDFAQLLATEVRNSLDFYAGQLSSNFSNQLFIHGDLAYSDELINQMNSHLGFEFCRFPSEQLDFVSEAQKVGLVSLSVSLQALGAAACGHRIGNLLPQDRIEQNQKRIVSRLAIAGLSLLTLILMLTWLGLVSANRTTEKNVSAVNQTIEQFRSSEIAGKLEQVKAELAMEQAYLHNSKEMSAHVGFNLKELSLITPGGIYLQLIEIDGRDKTNRSWRLAGTVVSSPTPNEIILADYVDILEQSQFFSSVTLERYRKRAVGNGFDLEFELAARSII